MLDKSNLKEVTAIELKYLGNTAEQISEKLDIPHRTIEGWFSKEGKLYHQYKGFTERTNKRRTKEFEDKISSADEEVLVITTNVIRMYSRRFLPRTAPLVRDDGTVVVDENDSPIMVEVEPENKVTGNDFYKAWQMQRIIKGLPTRYEKSDVEQDKDLLNMDEIIEALNLEAEDFLEENYGQTLVKITEYLSNGN